mgnify:CR=1 FL=1
MFCLILFLMVEKLSRYMKSSGDTYQDHYATLLHWYDKTNEELEKRTIGAEFLT